MEWYNAEREGPTNRQERDNAAAHIFTELSTPLFPIFTSSFVFSFAFEVVWR